MIGAMRAWRRGCRALLPWFRATAFASAYHYRDRTLNVAAPGTAPADVDRLARTLRPLGPSTLTVVDLPGATALWLAYLLRRRHRLAVALAFNGWYDPEACLDGRREIPLLLALGERLRGVGAGAEAALVFDRHRVLPVSAPARLDNCYRLGDEDVPSAEQLRSAGCRRVRLVTSGEPAPDLADWLSAIGAQIPVEIRVHVAGTAA